MFMIKTDLGISSEEYERVEQWPAVDSRLHLDMRILAYYGSDTDFPGLFTHACDGIHLRKP
jgi:hypothetical protein